MNNLKFNDYIDAIYSKELEIKDTTDAPKWANYLDLHLEFDEDSKLFTRLYDKCDDFDFPIVNFPYLSTSSCSNIPESPAYGVFVSQLMNTLCSGSILVSMSLKQGSILFTDTSRLLFGNSMVVIQTLFTNLTPLCHIC